MCIVGTLFMVEARVFQPSQSDVGTMAKEESTNSRGMSLRGEDSPPLNQGLDRVDYYYVIGLCGLILLFYAQLWMPGLVLIKRDAFQFYLPVKQYMIERLSAGEFPHWFPYDGLGRPFMATPATGVLHPFTALYWLFPVHDAYRLSVLCSYLAGGIGTFLLARSLGVSSAGSCIAAIGFSGSGYAVSLSENVIYLYSWCVLPIVLLVVRKFLSGGNVMWVAVAAVVWASVFLNGDLQTGYYFGFIVLLWAGMEGAQRSWHNLVRAVPIVILTVLLAGIQLAPAWAVFVGSTRSDADAFRGHATQWSTHPSRLLNLGITPLNDPDDGMRVAEAVAGKDKDPLRLPGYWAESLYLGLPLLGLALIGTWRCRQLRSFVVMGGCGIVLALGKYGGVYEWFYDWVPLWAAFRYPEKFMGLVSISVAMLAGGGFDALRGGRLVSAVWFTGAVLCLVLGGLLSLEAPVAWLGEAFQMGPALANRVTAALRQAILFGAVSLCGVGVMVLWMRLRPQQQLWASLGLAVILVLDLGRGNLPSLHVAPSEAWTFTPGLVSAVEEDARRRGYDRYRIHTIEDKFNAVTDEVRRTMSTYERAAVLRRQGLYPEHHTTAHLEVLECYLGGEGLLYQQVSANANEQVVARYNTAYFIGRPARFAQPLYEKSMVAAIFDYDLALVRNPYPVSPRVYLSQNPQPYSAPDDPVSFLRQEEFLSGAMDVIEGGPGVMPEAGNQGRAEILDYRPEHVLINVETSQPAFLILLDSFGPGWEARIVGGDELPIYRANGIVRGVQVPAGHSEVVFSYETPLLRVGAALSLLGLCVSAVLLAGRWNLPSPLKNVREV